MTFLHLSSDQMGQGHEAPGRKLLVAFPRQFLDAGAAVDVIGCVNTPSWSGRPCVPEHSPSVAGHAAVSTATAPRGVHLPRHPERTPLYRMLEDEFERFVRVYDERFEHPYGFLRHVVPRVVHQYLECGRPEGGFARLRCPFVAVSTYSRSVARPATSV